MSTIPFPAPIVVPSDAATVLRMPRFVETAVRVLDEATGERVPNARAYGPASWRDHASFREGYHHPSGAMLGRPVRTAGADGRVDLGLRAAETRWYFVADGRAWMAAAVEPGAAPAIRLRPGGVLRLSVPRWKHLDAATVGTDPQDDADRVELPGPGDDGTVRIEGMQPGIHTIVVGRGPHSKGLEYGRGKVEILAGAEAELTIDADAPDPRRKVNVTGRIHVPEAWRGWPTRITIEGSEAQNVDARSRDVPLAPPEEGREMTFEITDVTEGKYRVLLDPFQWRERFVAGPGPTDWRVDLGVPCEVHVTILEAGTGKPAAGARLMWSTQIGLDPDKKAVMDRLGIPEAQQATSARLFSDQTSWTSQTAGEPDADGTFVFRSPALAVGVAASAPGFVDAEADVDPVPGTTTKVTLRLVRAAVVIVELERDGKPFTESEPAVSIRRSEIGNLDHGEEQPIEWTRNYGSHQGAVRIEDAEPGPCTILVEADSLPSGWECTQEVVELVSGKTTRVVLRLTRKP